MFTEEEKQHMTREVMIYSGHMKFERAHVFVDGLLIPIEDRNLLHEQIRIAEKLREKYVLLLNKILEL